MEGYRWGDGGTEWGEGIGNKKDNWQAQNRQGEVKNSVKNGVAKELICMICGHEVRGAGPRGIRGREKWDNSKSIIHTIDLKNILMYILLEFYVLNEIKFNFIKK